MKNQPSPLVQGGQGRELPDDEGLTGYLIALAFVLLSAVGLCAAIATKVTQHHTP